MTARSVFRFRHFCVPPKLPLHSGLNSLGHLRHHPSPAARTLAAACGQVSKAALKPEQGQTSPGCSGTPSPLLSPHHPCPGSGAERSVQSPPSGDGSVRPPAAARHRLVLAPNTAPRLYCPFSTAWSRRRNLVAGGWGTAAGPACGIS